MSAPAHLAGGTPTLRLRGVSYPVLLPSARDPRLHLATVIVSLQVLGQVAFGFRLSLAQIAVSLGTCALLELAIVFRRQQVIMWPASALLTGNGVAFILRVPGTEHGDWWSLRGWWIYAGTAAVALLSKYVVRYRGRHVFNPSNLGLVLCFLVLGPELADPLEFWWGPLDLELGFALALIVTGGILILRRLRLLGIAVTFWVTFAACIAVLAVSGHAMTARWHLGPLTGTAFWQALLLSPEVLVFLFFMITDPKTVPSTRRSRSTYAVCVAVVAALAIAPATTEFASKVALLGALTLVCASRPFVESFWARFGLRPGRVRPLALGAGAMGTACGIAALLVLAGLPARAGADLLPAPIPDAAAPRVTIAASSGVASTLDLPTARRVTAELVTGLSTVARALRRHDTTLAAKGATGSYLAALLQQIDQPSEIAVASYSLQRAELHLELAPGQGPPLVVADVVGTKTVNSSDPKPFRGTFRLAQADGRYLIDDSSDTAGRSAASAVDADLGELRLTDVATEVGLDFHHGAFRFEVTADPVAMMGGGVCWLDYDGDGWLDLYLVNSYSELDVGDWERRGGGLPRSALFRNVGGRFVDVSRGSGANLLLRANGCVAADLDVDGDTDLFVTAAGYDALLWNDGDGTFTEGAVEAGIASFGWHTGAAVGDVDGNGRPDLFVAGYTDLNAPIPGSAAGFPTTHQGVSDRLYLNEAAPNGTSRFREVGARIGLDDRAEHGLGAVFIDVDRDGRLDLYVANDADPNRLYLNISRPTALGFTFVERARRDGVDDPNAGMGIAAADYDDDGRGDLYVTNSHRQLPAVFRGASGERLFTDARPAFADAFDTRLAGWGTSWVDLDNDGALELVSVNGAIPVLDLRRDAQRVQVLANASDTDEARFADVGGGIGLSELGSLNGRGLAAADYDNDGDVDVAVNSIGGSVVLLETTGATGNWLGVEFDPPVPGTVVIAALEDGRRLVRTLTTGSSYLSSEDPRLHFGLGEATLIERLVVAYPNGTKQRLEDVAGNRLITVSR